MTQYIILFEDGDRVSSVLLGSSPQEVEGRKKWGDEWCSQKPNRKWIISDNSSPMIKLVDGKIKAMTKEEIEARKKPIKSLDTRIDELEKQIEIINHIIDNLVIDVGKLKEG
jgi:hypothetical protein